MTLSGRCISSGCLAGPTRGWQRSLVNSKVGRGACLFQGLAAMCGERMSTSKHVKEPACLEVGGGGLALWMLLDGFTRNILLFFPLLLCLLPLPLLLFWLLSLQDKSSLFFTLCSGPLFVLAHSQEPTGAFLSRFCTLIQIKQMIACK